METRQGKIEKKSMAFAKNKAPYATFTIDGKNYNSFDKEIIDAHNPDDFVEFTGEQDGPYWTLKTMKIVPVDIAKQAKPGPTTQNGAKEYHLSPEEVKCRALECAIEMQASYSGDNVFEVVMQRADKFVEWIRNGN